MSTVPHVAIAVLGDVGSAGSQLETLQGRRSQALKPWRRSIEVVLGLDKCGQTGKDISTGCILPASGKLTRLQCPPWGFVQQQKLACCTAIVLFLYRNGVTMTTAETPSTLAGTALSVSGSQ